MTADESDPRVALPFESLLEDNFSGVTIEIEPDDPMSTNDFYVRESLPRSHHYRGALAAAHSQSTRAIGCSCMRRAERPPVDVQWPGEGRGLATATPPLFHTSYQQPWR